MCAPTHGGRGVPSAAERIAPRQNATQPRRPHQVELLPSEASGGVSPNVAGQVDKGVTVIKDGAREEVGKSGLVGLLDVEERVAPRGGVATAEVVEVVVFDEGGEEVATEPKGEVIEELSEKHALTGGKILAALEAALEKEAAKKPKHHEPEIHAVKTFAELIRALADSDYPLETITASLPALLPKLTSREMNDLRVGVLARANMIRSTRDLNSIMPQAQIVEKLFKIGLSPAEIDKRKREEERRAHEGGDRASSASAGGTVSGTDRVAPQESTGVSERTRVNLRSMLEDATREEASGTVSWNKVWGQLRKELGGVQAWDRELSRHQRYRWLVKSYLETIFGREELSKIAPNFIRRQSTRQE